MHCIILLAFEYHWPIILHDTFIHPYLLHYQSDRNCEVWNFTKHWKKKKGKWLSSQSLWAPTQVAVRLILPFTDNHETDPREKGKDLTQLSPMTTWQPWQHKNATKNFDYTTISDRLRTVSWSNDSYPTGVVKPVYGIPTFPPKRIFRPNAIFLPQCLSWSASFSSSFDFCSKF